MESKKGYKGCSTEMKHRFTNGKKKHTVSIGGNWGSVTDEVGGWDEQNHTNISERANQ